MTYCYHVCICLFLIIVQTTVMPYIPLFQGFYDLLTPFVIFLCIFRPLRESIPVILFFGFVMEAISGGTFGLYLTTYLWLFIGVRWIITFLHVGNNPLLPFIVVAGVLMENLIIVGSNVIFDPGLRFTSEMSITIGVQVFWAIFTGPMFLLFFNYSFGKWDKRVKEIFTRKVDR